MVNYGIFLRGINVNGIKIKMKELTLFLKTLNDDHVKTLGATGNIILSRAQPIEDLSAFKKALELKLSQHYGYEAFLFIRREDELKDLLASAEKLVVAPTDHIYALFIDETSTQEALLETFETLDHHKDERLLKVNKDLFWCVEKGYTLSSEFGKKALGNKYFKSKLTSRNLNTIYKVYKAMG